MNRKIVIAVDGPAGSGKSTVALRVAQELGYQYIDTGAMYRAMAWLALQGEIPLENHEALTDVVQKSVLLVHQSESGMGVSVNGRDISSEIRSERISTATSMIAAVPGVRRHLVGVYRKLGARGGVVMEGRDIGTVAFPGAELKIDLTADMRTRARRRMQQQGKKAVPGDLENVEESIRLRDDRDSRRRHAPLYRAPDAIEIDTTRLDVEQVTRRILELAHRRIHASTED